MTHHSMAVYSSPLGFLIIESDGLSLTGLRFADENENIITERINTAIDSSVIAETRQWLDAYFKGRIPIHTPRLNPHGTNFQRRVWQALLTIPYGKTRSYGQIADIIGCRSAQAVGQAIGHNPIALIIPCHRVIGSNGSLTGYAYGISLKQELITLEKKK